MDNREFRGIWIPKHIWLDKNLSVTEKFLLAEIESYDNDFGCIATNKTLCRDLMIKPNTCSGLIKSMEQKGYLSVQYENENSCEGRVIKVIDSPLRKSEAPPFGNPKGPSEKSEPSNTFSNNNYSNKNLNLIAELKNSAEKDNSSDSVKAEKLKKEDSAHHRIIAHFFEEMHTDFIFTPTHAKTVSFLITKIKKLFVKKGRPVDERSVGDFGISLLDNLPSYYAGKDLAVINSKFNEIILELTENKNGKPRQTAAQDIRDQVRNTFGSRNTPSYQK